MGLMRVSDDASTENLFAKGDDEELGPCPILCGSLEEKKVIKKNNGKTKNNPPVRPSRKIIGSRISNMTLPTISFAPPLKSRFARLPAPSAVIPVAIPEVLAPVAGVVDGASLPLEAELERDKESDLELHFLPKFFLSTLAEFLILLGRYEIALSVDRG